MAKQVSIETLLQQLDDMTQRAERLASFGTSLPSSVGRRATAVSEARQLHVGSAMLAGSVFFDSAVEHYRGSFKNPAMYLALASAATSLAAGIHGASRETNRSEPTRDVAYLTAAAVGIVGTGFHAYNIAKREGGISWNNAFYAAPIGAPAALILSGLLGFAAERVRDAPPDTSPTIFGFPAGRLLSGFTAVGLLGTTGEAGLLHFRGRFQNPFMYLPVTLPPLAAAILGNATATPTRRNRRWAGRWLGATAFMGFAGVAFHIYGVSRAMGGWKNWRQNVVDGPPIPAPPSFTGLSVAGMAALRLLERKG